MALPASLVWEVRTTGNDLNGGAFDAGLRASGTDYSQQDAPQATYSDLKADAADGSKVASVARPFQAGDVGNTLRIPSGVAGFTEGVYVIQSVSGGVATLDRACGTVGASQASGTVRLGGAVASFSRLAADMVAHNLAFVKSGSYSEPGTVTFNQDAGTLSPTNPPTRLVGYSAVRADYDTPGLSRPVVTVGGTGDGLVSTTNGWALQNLEVTGVGAALGMVVNFTGGSVSVSYCKVSGFKTGGINTSLSSGWVHACEVTNVAGVSPAEGIMCKVATDCYLHDFDVLYNALMCEIAIRNVIANLGGPGIGIRFMYSGMKIAYHNTISNIGGSGIGLGGGSASSSGLIRGNIVAKCGGYGLESDVGGDPRHFQIDGNAYGGGGAASGLGDKYGLDDDGSVNAVDADLTYRYTRDVTTSGDPFLDAAGGDFRLNSGPGAALKGTARSDVGAWLPVSGGLDFGALPGGGTGDASSGGPAGHGYYYF